MNRPTVFVALQQFCESDDRPLRLLQEAGFDVRRNELGRRLKREEMLPLLQEADAILAGVEPYDAQLLRSLSRLKVISRCGVGTDSIDLETAQKLKVAVFTTAEEVVEPVAQMTVGMILALARHFPQHLRDMGQGKWRKQTGFLLSEWTIGLVGFGRIGQAVGRYLQIFGPKILAADPRLHPEEVPAGITLCDLGKLLAESDLVSLHASRSKEEGPLLGHAELFSMKPGSRLVNTARGYLVDERGLEEALSSGRLSAAALDVFEEEPYQGRLRDLPQVLCTPHVSTLTRASRSAMEFSCARNVLRFFNGKTDDPSRLVDKPPAAC